MTRMIGEVTARTFRYRTDDGYCELVKRRARAYRKKYPDRVRKANARQWAKMKADPEKHALRLEARRKAWAAKQWVKKVDLEKL